MINEEELQISNKSYINKDFAAIYPELIDLIKKLTNAWDPQTSNESDPGIVLTKLAGFIGDKINYNSDKNVLENFLPSATQLSSVRDLVERLDYSPRWYESAVVKVDITNNSSTEVSLNKYSTILSDEGNNITYFICEGSITIPSEESRSVLCMQGETEELKIDNSNKITLDNIDDNNRVYFPTTKIAQNGIFINTSSVEKPWERVDNLNVIAANQRVYKFGYDSFRKLCYVEFPDDISNLIEDGLYIRYTKTDGLGGNIKAKVLTKISSVENIDEATLEKISVINTEGTITGKDAEDIDEIYNSFKKTVGVLNSLVTCRDYANYIYNMIHEDTSSPYVSNVQVSDRRDDLNYSSKMITLDDLGPIYTNGELSELSGKEITPYELCLYPLCPYTSDTLDGYNNSFRELPVTSDIELKLEDAKSISHNYKELADDDIYYIQNKYNLNVQVSTKYKVNSVEQKSIISNIKTALMKNFNARKIDYGYEIPYDEIIKVIENADIRISSVYMSEPEIIPEVIKANGESEEFKNSEGKYTIFAKNILAGKISLFDYVDEFNFEFGQSNGHIIKNIKSITPRLGRTISSSESILNNNEVIQILSPNYTDDTTYSSYVYYRFDDLSENIPANTNYTLREGEELKFWWKDSDNNPTSKIYGEGITINANFLVNEDAEYTIEKDDPEKKYAMLNAGQQIVIKNTNSVKLDKKNTPCYWLLNNSDNEIQWNSDKIYVLDNDEYFFYTEDNYNSLVTLGSGTKLTLNGSGSNDWKVSKVSYEELVNNGLLSEELRNKWKIINFNTNYNLTWQEMSVLTLSKGDSIKLENDSIEFDNNDYTPLASSYSPIVYKFSGESEAQTLNILDDDNWLIRGRLDLNCSNTESQKLNQANKLIVEYEGQTTPVEIHTEEEFNFNGIVQVAGRDNISFESTDTNNRYPLSIYYYTPNDSSSALETNSLGQISIKLEANTPKTIYLPNIGGEDGVITINNHLPDGDLKITVDGGEIYYFNPEEEIVSTDTIRAGVSTLKLDGVGSLTFVSSTDGIVVLGKLRYYSDFNSVLQLTSEEKDDLLEEIGKFDEDGRFYYTASIDNSNIIESEDLTSAEAFYDYNNVANKFTLSKIDLDSSKIFIVKNSRLS